MIDPKQGPFHAVTPRYKMPAVPPPNGTRFDCPLCGCKPGEPHIVKAYDPQYRDGTSPLD